MMDWVSCVVCQQINSQVFKWSLHGTVELNLQPVPLSQLEYITENDIVSKEAKWHKYC